jgi:Flp pilus assembly pilin Flp
VQRLNQNFFLNKGGHCVPELRKRLWQDECGQDLVEYVLLMIMVTLAVVASVRTVGQSVANSMTAASSNLMVNVSGSSSGSQQQGNGSQGNGHGDGDGNGHGNGNGGNGSNGQGNGSQGGGGGNGP